jgi:hypothetical protein
MLRREVWPVAEDDRALHDVLEFPDVARPAVCCDAFEGVVRETVDRLAVLLGEAPQKVRG